MSRPLERIEGEDEHSGTVLFEVLLRVLFVSTHDDVREFAREKVRHQGGIRADFTSDENGGLLHCTPEIGPGTMYGRSRSGATAPCLRRFRGYEAAP